MWLYLTSSSGCPVPLAVVVGSIKLRTNIMCKKQCETTNQPPHQEKIELIYALSNALEALSKAPRKAGANSDCPVRSATDGIAKELSKLTTQD